MAQNKILDLNNPLFETLERLNDDDYMAENAEREIPRAKAITGIASQIIALGQLSFSVQKHKDEWGTAALPGGVIGQLPAGTGDKDA